MAQSKNVKGKNNPNYKGGSIEKKCLNCNNKFKVLPCNIDIAKYCLKECHSKGRTKRTNMVCRRCGKEFFVISSQVHKGRKYCSRKCFGNEPNQIKRICEKCGKKFFVKLSLTRGRRGIFCSKKCRVSSLFTGGKKESRKREYIRIKNNSHLRLRSRISILINSRLKRRFFSKEHKSIFNFLPWTVEELERHLEKLFQPGMSWQNYGLYGWHIDHKIPDSYFNYQSVNDEEFKQC